ncbi:MAG: hypothetical protein HYX69_13745 [Planctomycetia bacterium]|nr:hypothetical protein [Planctomycetia bacterium]
MNRPWLGALAFVATMLAPACAADVEPLPGTKPLLLEGDPASQMVDGIDRFLLREIDASVGRRAARWQRDASSVEKYNASVAANRERLAKIIGAVDPRVSPVEIDIPWKGRHPPVLSTNASFTVLPVRWPVLRGLVAEGLILDPRRSPPVATVVVLPDADQTPEMLAGLAPGVPAESQFARRLAESGCYVIVPYLIDRASTHSIGAGGTRPTNQPHREFIYRQAYELGRHVIGYEVQKVMALVDHFAEENRRLAPKQAIGVMGYGEGGLLALFAGALDTRIDAVCVSGYFAPRERVWEEPIYRNVFALLHEFGDAELASLAAPRPLVIEAARGPEVAGPLQPGPGVSGGAAPGKLATPKLADVEREVARAKQLCALKWPIALVASGDDGTGPPGTPAALEALLAHLKPDARLAPPGKDPEWATDRRDTGAVKRQFDQMVDYTQHLLAEAEYTRREFWKKADRQSRSIERWQETTEPYRKYFYDEVIGRFDYPKLPPDVRTRKVYDEAAYTGYEVMMDVFPDVFAYGILLVPKGIKPGERRAVVVCQHGLEGRPQFVADPKVNNPAYNQYAVRLAERGFVTYAPQNPYIFQDRFRTLQRKANPLKKTLFSIIVPQHEQAVDWLASLDFVDPRRIAFYGLSYGGKTAMRVPAIVQKYCLSICSADFNEWIWKNASARSSYSYLHTGEYEMFEFDLGNTFNYAEMAWLIAPRPFMVERGHRDGVAPDEWVAYEYARVRQLYADLKIPERTTIEFFDGPHTINGVGTFEFLERQLKSGQKTVGGRQ